MITRIKLTIESLAVIAIATAFFAQTIYFQSKLRVPTQDVASQLEHNLHLLEEIREMHIGTNGKLNSIANNLELRLSPGAEHLFIKNFDNDAKKRTQSRHQSDGSETRAIRESNPEIQN